jgi:hypothetical protein
LNRKNPICRERGHVVTSKNLISVDWYFWLDQFVLESATCRLADRRPALLMQGTTPTRRLQSLPIADEITADDRPCAVCYYQARDSRSIGIRYIVMTDLAKVKLFATTQMRSGRL